MGRGGSPGAARRPLRDGEREGAARHATADSRSSSREHERVEEGEKVECMVASAGLGRVG